MFEGTYIFKWKTVWDVTLNGNPEKFFSLTQKNFIKFGSEGQGDVIVPAPPVN